MKPKEAEFDTINSGWVEFLLECWHGELPHSYTLRHRSWIRSNGNSTRWVVKNLKEAADKYWWNNSGAEKSKEDFKLLRARLQKSMNDPAAEGLRQTCLDILKWGGVGGNTKKGENPTVGWINRAVGSDALRHNIRQAVQYLSEGNSDKFDGSSFVMNSGATKIIALADPSEKIIIYDGRVGCALAYLANVYLTKIKKGSLPDFLRYGWGGARSKDVNRNPNTPGRIFPRLGSLPHSDRKHAEYAYRASKLIETLLEAADCRLVARDWEAALFMIGYEIPDSTSTKI